MRDARRWIAGSTALVAVLAVVGAFFILVPVSLDELAPEPDPASRYAEGLEDVRELESHDTSGACEMVGGLFLGCDSELLDHGERTDCVVVLFHGVTNCPLQMRALGEAYFEAGCNVLLARTPYHGSTDREGQDLSNLTEEDLREVTDASIDAANGLGDEVIVIGLSGGGTQAAWAAAHRTEVDQAVMVAPYFTPGFVPLWAGDAAVRVLKVLPERTPWWDVRAKEYRVAPPQAYQRFSLKAMAAYMTMGIAARELEPGREGDIPRVTLVTNAADHAVDNDSAKAFTRLYLEPIAEDVVYYEFEKEYDYPHDFLDPTRVDLDEQEHINGVIMELTGIEQAEDDA